ncbi:MAG: GAF domain-containing protein [Anaerolineae bacterium]|nr:GAF domain-containing protein [Anaerolineae bacterium]
MQAVNIIGEISAMLAQSFELDLALETILQSIGSTIRYDASEVNQWYPDQNVLRPIARRGDPGYAAALDQNGGVYKLDEGYSGWIARYQQPLVVDDINTRPDVLPKLANFPFHSYIGVPLKAGDRFIGTLELASSASHAFDYEHLTLLETLAGQVAVAMENARLYREQSNRVAEISGLRKIAQAMGALADPPSMFMQLNTSLAELMNVEMCGVMLLSDDRRWLAGQVPLYGVQEALAYLFRIEVLPESAGYRLWHNQPWWFTNNAVGDEMIHQLKLQTLVDVSSVHALALVPMIVGDQRIGAVMVMNPRRGSGFLQEDVNLLAVFAAQVAIVVENARLYNEEQRRAEELMGLQQITEAVGALRDPAALYQQINERIAQLLDTEACTLLLFVEEARLLVLQPGSVGLPGSLAPFAQVPLEAGSRLEQLWEQGQPWLSNSIQAEGRALQARLGHFWKKPRCVKGCCCLCAWRGNALALLLVGNKAYDLDFDTEDSRLLSIFARQAAVIIDNARLYDETHRRAVESDGLRRLAELAAGAVDIDQIIADLLAETTDLLEAQVAALALLDTDKGELVYTPGYAYQLELAEPLHLDIFGEGFSNSVVLSRRALLSNAALEDARLLRPYRQMAEDLNLHNLIMVPLVIQNRSIGEVLVANKRSEGFSPNDLNLLQAIAAQVAAAIDRTQLYKATDASLRTRVDQLNTMDRVAQQLVGSLELERILEVARTEIANTLGGGAASAVLLARSTRWLDTAQPLIEKRLNPLPGMRDPLSPAEMSAILRTEPLYISDYLGSDLEALPAEARSAFIVPFRVEEEPVALLHLYSNQPAAFDEDTRDFVLRIAKQTNQAVLNARRFQDQLLLNERLRQHAQWLRSSLNINQFIRQGKDIGQTLVLLAGLVSEALGYRVVIINLLDAKANVYKRVASAGISELRFRELQQAVTTPEQLGQLLQTRWQLGESYFIPTEQIGEDTLGGIQTPRIHPIPSPNAAPRPGKRMTSCLRPSTIKREPCWAGLAWIARVITAAPPWPRQSRWAFSPSRPRLWLKTTSSWKKFGAMPPKPAWGANAWPCCTAPLSAFARRRISPPVCRWWPRPWCKAAGTRFGSRARQKPGCEPAHPRRLPRTGGTPPANRYVARPRLAPALRGPRIPALAPGWVLLPAL